MFCHYISAKTGARIDIERASYLMDKTLGLAIRETCVEMLGLTPFDKACAGRSGMSAPKATEEQILQTIWDEYCRAHLAKYGVPFTPNVDPEWC